MFCMGCHLGKSGTSENTLAIPSLFFTSHLDNICPDDKIKSYLYFDNLKGYKMIVLSIIAIIVALIVIYVSITSFNSWTNKKFKYTFFNWTSYIIISISYALIALGVYLYLGASKVGEDVLNEYILIFIGSIVVLGVILFNFSETNFMVGMIGTVFQLVVHLALSLAGLIALVVMIGVASNTKPVYNMND